MMRIMRFVLGAVFAIGFSITAEAVELCDYIIGGCPQDATPPASTSAPAEDKAMQDLPGHGSWAALVDEGEVVLIDSFPDDVTFSIVHYGEGPDIGPSSLIVSVPNWNLSKGEKFDVKMSVDDRTFSYVAVAMDDRTVVLNDLGAEFIARFYGGERAEVTVAGRTFKISSLKDAFDTLIDAQNYRKAKKASN